MIADDLVDHVSAAAEERTVSDLRVGLGYAAVRLDDGSCGLALTFREEAGDSCSAVQKAGTVAGRPAAELVRWSFALDTVTAAVGVATVNALVRPPADADEADVRDAVRVGRGDVVGMVGHFGPLVGMLEERAVTLHIFERRAVDGPGVKPDWAAPLLLPECDVVIISGSTVVNRTVDELLARATRAREVVVVGPSTPMAPEVFEGRGVTLLSGTNVVEADQVLRVVSEGGGTRQFGRAVQKLCVRLGGR